MINHFRSLVNRFRAVPPFKLGGLPSQPSDAEHIRMLSQHFKVGIYPASYTVSTTVQLPIQYQLHEDCGPCAWVNALHVATGGTYSPRYGYYVSRKMAGTFPNDTGTYNVYNSRCVAIGNTDFMTWPYEGDINEVPTTSANTNAATHRFTSYLATTADALKTAISSNHLPIIHVNATSDWYYPTLRPDGSYEIITPNTLSKRVGGHFICVDAYDSTRKMMDGTTGGFRVVNQWGSGWGQGGRAWISDAGWIAANGDPNSRYVVTTVAAPVLPPLTFDLIGAPTGPINKNTVVRITFNTNADLVRCSDSLWHSSRDYAPTEVFGSTYPANDLLTFQAIRKADGASITKTVQITIQ